MPALQRAGCRLRPGLALDEGPSGRRRLGAHRAEGVEHLGAPCRLRRAAGEDGRPTCPSAAGSPTSSWTCEHRASRFAPCGTSPVTSTSTRSFSIGSGFPTPRRVGAENDGWSGRQRNACRANGRWLPGSGSGGVDRIGGGGADRLLSLARPPAPPGRTASDDTVTRQRLVSLWSEDRMRNWTNQRVRAGLKTGRPLGPESSIGKVHQGDLNQRMQIAAVDLLGAGATAWVGTAGDRGEGPVTPERYGEGLPLRGHGHAAESGQYHRGGDDRSQQERGGRACARTSPGARSVAGRAVAGRPRS